MAATKLSLLIVSGGTAFNDAAATLRTHTARVSYVLPVSDDGGSTAEIVRVLGGPAVGDVRSRCLRLSAEATEEERAVKALLGHRLCGSDENSARQEWFQIVEGSHTLWNHISREYKQIIRRFLGHFFSCVLKENRNFCFGNGSVGNFFFAGARLFFGSIESAIFLYGRVSGVPPESHVLPAIVDLEERVRVACELESGEVVHGQSAISHPVATGSWTHGVVSKECDEPLPAPIKEVFYTYRGAEMWPTVNESVVHHLETSEVIVFAMGSLFTSIIPCLVLRGVGEAVLARPSAQKVLLLNGSHDRETFGLSASDFVRAIRDGLNRTREATPLTGRASDYVSVVAYPAGGAVPVDREALAEMGIEHVIELPSELSKRGEARFATEPLCNFLTDLASSASC